MEQHFGACLCKVRLWKPCKIPVLLRFEAGPAAGEDVGVMEEPAGDGIANASGVWLKSSLQMGDWEL